MRRKPANRTNSNTSDPAAPQRAAATPGAEPRPLVRREVALCGLAVLALCVGYYGGQYARARLLSPTAEEGADLTAREELSPVSAVATQPAPLLDIDPDSPLPDTAESLIQEARNVVEQLLAGLDPSPDLLELKARMQIWLGQSAEAVETWKACLQLDPRYVHAYVGMASAAAERSNHEQAADLAGQAIELVPQNYQAREILATALLQLGRADEVPGVLEEFLTIDPRSRGFLLLGQACSQLKQYEKACQNFQSAIRIFPGYWEAYNGLATAYARLGEVEKAAAAREKFAELTTPEKMAARIRGVEVSDLEMLQQKAAVLYTDAGRVCYVSQQEQAAERLWLRAAALDPQNMDCRQSLAWLYRNANRPGDNIYWLQQLAELDSSQPTYWIEIGRIYDQLFILPAAEDAFRKAIEAAPQDDAGYAACADLLVRYEQNLAEAQELAKKAVSLQPSAPNYAILAMAHRGTGDLAGGRTAIDQAIKLAPRNVTYRAIRDSIQAKD